MSSWADFDNDGNLDLFVANAEKDILFRNLGNGSFSKITTGVIANNAGGAQGCAWADYDNDGYPDLFVGQIARGVNVLYHNERNGTFTKVTTGKIATDGGQTQGIAWGDYDNDGYLDLFVANIGQKISCITMTGRVILQRSPPALLPMMSRNSTDASGPILIMTAGSIFM